MLIKKQKSEVLEGDIVRFVPIFGIKPGKYLAALYALILLAALFFVFVFPGLYNPGVRLLVKSNPPGAAVRVDDVYFDSTPCNIFVSKGNHSITVVRGGFNDFNTDIEAGNKVFASLFFPLKIDLKVELKETEPLLALKLGASDYAAWTFVGEATDAYQIPLCLSESAIAPADIDAALPILEAAARFMTTKAALKDLVRSVFLVANGGNAASPFTAVDSARIVLNYMNKNNAFAVALADILPDSTAKKLIDSSFFPQVWVDNVVFKPGKLGRSETVRNIRFSNMFLPSTYVQDANFQHKESVGEFAIAVNEISSNQWEDFLSENPYWQRSNLPQLLEKKYVTKNYLILSDDYHSQSAAGMSWYAAVAFCEWLNSKLSPALASSYEVRLPTEAEWEYTAHYLEKAGNLLSTPLGGRDLWEWCLDYYAPLNYLPADAAAINAIKSIEHSVRGGSWANSYISPYIRASLSGDFCSSYVGFRPVLAAKAR